MINREIHLITEQLELFELDLTPTIEDLEYEIDVGEGFDQACIVAEAEDGEFTISIDGVESTQISEYSKVRVFLGKIVEGTKTILIRISAKGAKNLKLTIATIKESFKNAINQLPCRACKTFFKIAVSSILAHLGVPYLDATKTVDMPDIEVPSSLIPGAPSIPANGTIPVLVGKPIELSESTKQWFVDAIEESNGALAQYFNDIDPNIISSIRFVLESLNWFYGGADKIYTKVCEILRCCPIVA